MMNERLEKLFEKATDAMLEGQPPMAKGAISALIDDIKVQMREESEDDILEAAFISLITVRMIEAQQQQSLLVVG